MRTDPTFWIVARAGGLTAYALITLSALLGLTLRSRPFGKRPKAPVLLEVHRFSTLLALSAVAVHGVGLLYDTSIHIDVLGLLVPGRISYRPIWTGAGVVAAELAVAIAVSFWVRKRIGMANWRRLHWFTYAVFAAVTAHGLMSGSDSNTSWAQAIYLAAIGSVVLATTWRALTARRPVRRALAAVEPAPQKLAA